MRAPAVLLVVLGPLHGAPASAVEAHGRVSAGPEADSNARREIGGEAPHADLLWRMQADAEVSEEAAGHRLGLSGAWGQKLFLRERSEDLLVGEIRARHEARWLSWLTTFS